jgi:hypothetical protein
MAARFTASYTGIGQMLVAPYMIEEMGARADRVLARCVETAPVYTGPFLDLHRGRYKASFHRSPETIKTSGKGTKRALGRVVNDSPEAFWVEYGTRNNDAHHTMRNALDAAGG